MNDAAFTKSVLISGVLFGVLTALPPFSILNYCTCCSMFAAAGFLAAYLLKKDSPEPVSLGRGAQAGLGAGFLGGLINSIFTIPVALLLRSLVPTDNDFWQSLLDNLGKDNSALARLVQELSAKGADAIEIFSAAWMFLTIARSLLTVFFFCIFGVLGGILCISLLEKRTPAPPTTGSSAPPQWPSEPAVPPPPIETL